MEDTDSSIAFSFDNQFTFSFPFLVLFVIIVRDWECGKKVLTAGRPKRQEINWRCMDLMREKVAIDCT